MGYSAVEFSSTDLERGAIASAWDDEENAAYVLALDERDWCDLVSREQWLVLKKTWASLKTTFMGSLRKVAADMGFLDSFGEIRAMKETGTFDGFSSNHLRPMLEQIRLESSRKRTQHALRHALSLTEDRTRSLEELQGAITTDLARAFSSTAREKAIHESVALRRLSEHLNEMESRAVTGDQTGAVIPTGIEPLDDVITGLGSSETIVLAARPRVGKTTMALQIARHVALSGEVLLLSLEMSERALATRIACQELQIPKTMINSSNALRTSELQARNLWITEERISPARLTQKIEMFLMAHPKLKLVVIDHLGIFAGDGADYKATTLASNAVRGAAKKTGIPILLLAQLSRAVENRPGDSKPRLSDLNMSGSIEQDARKIVFLHRPWLQTREGDPAHVLAVVAKNSEGEEADIPLHYNGPTFTFFSPAEIGKSVNFPTHNAPEFEEISGMEFL